MAPLRYQQPPQLSSPFSFPVSPGHGPQKPASRLSKLRARIKAPSLAKRITFFIISLIIFLFLLASWRRAHASLSAGLSVQPASVLSHRQHTALRAVLESQLRPDQSPGRPAHAKLAEGAGHLYGWTASTLGYTVARVQDAREFWQAGAAGGAGAGERPGGSNPGRVGGRRGELLFSEGVTSAAASGHTLILTAGGEVYSLGRDWDHARQKSGQLGREGEFDAPGAVLGHLATRKVVGVAAGRFHSVALTSEGEVFSWGLNNRGQLGRSGGRKAETFHPGAVDGALERQMVVQVAAGGHHSMAITREGHLYTWGANWYHGEDPWRAAPREEDPAAVKRAIAVAAAPRRVEGALAGEAVVQVACGEDHWAALTQLGEVFTASTGFDKLGLKFDPELTADALTRVDESGLTSPGRATGELLEGGRVVQVAAARCATFALTDEGRLLSWGCPADVLGRGSNPPQADVPGAVGEGSPLAAPGVRVVEIAAAGDYALARLDDGRVFAWGDNRFAQLGFPAPQSTALPLEVSSLEHLRVLRLTAGTHHGLAIGLPKEAAAAAAAAAAPGQGALEGRAAAAAAAGGYDPTADAIPGIESAGEAGAASDAVTGAAGADAGAGDEPGADAGASAGEGASEAGSATEAEAAAAAEAEAVAVPAGEGEGLQQLLWAELEAEEAARAAGARTRSTDFGGEAVPMEARSRAVKKRGRFYSHGRVAGAIQEEHRREVLEVGGDLLEVVPRAGYEKVFRNPCWHARASAAGAFRCLPAFFVIGAARSGTLDLYSRVAMVGLPGIAPASDQSPHWWDLRGQENATWYLDRFKDASLAISGDPTMITGEASATLLTSSGVATRGKRTGFLLPELMHAFLPKAKLIVMLRNPVDRWLSSFFYYPPPPAGSDGPEDKREDAANFAAHAEQQLALMRACLAGGTPNGCVRELYNSTAQQLCRSMYVYFLKDWLAIYPQKQVLVLRFEDYVRDLRGHLQQVISFLGLPKPSKSKWEEMLARGVDNTRLRGEDVEVEEGTRALLDEFFAPHNEGLAKLLQNDLFKWADAGAPE